MLNTLVYICVECFLFIVGFLFIMVIASRICKRFLLLFLLMIFVLLMNIYLIYLILSVFL